MLHVIVSIILFVLICVVIFNYKKEQIEDAKELMYDFKATYYTNGLDPAGSQEKQSL